MSPPIHPYTLSPHQAGLTLDDRGRFVWPSDRPRRTKVAIFGACGHRAMCRDGIFDDPSWIIFALNNFWNVARDAERRLRADVWFEFHQIRPDRDGVWRGRAIQDCHDLEWLRTCPVPIYVVEPFPENPRAVVWPFDHYFARYRRYVACSFAAQLMTALEEGFAEVAVYGLSLLNGTQRETTVEASNVAYWLGYLEGHGVTVHVPEDEHGTPQLLLMHPYVYGAEYWVERDWVERYLAHWTERPRAI